MMVVSLLLLFCQLAGPAGQGHPPYRAPAALAQGRLTSNALIYRRDRELVFRVRHFDRQGKRVDTDTLRYITRPAVFSNPAYGQTQSVWKLKDELLENTSGVTENDTVLWIHPYRFGAYRILELSPFPMVKYPLQTGSRWQWGVTAPGRAYGSKAWVEWEGNKTFLSTYRVVGRQTVDTPLGQLDCYEVRAVCRSDFGETRLRLYFNRQYGFVRMHYDNINGTAMHLELIEERFKSPFLNGGKLTGRTKE
jgi:hypothetical protein